MKKMITMYNRLSNLKSHDTQTYEFVCKVCFLCGLGTGIFAFLWVELIIYIIT